MSQNETTYDSDPTVNRFVENHNADRYEETDAAISEDNATGYIDPSMCVTLFGKTIRIHPDIEGSPYGVDVSTYAKVVSYEETSLKEDTDGYVFESPERETHNVDKEFVDMVANVFDTDIESVLENAHVKEEWPDFPVLFKHPERDGIRMMVAPYIK
jgi:hypothetical protein